LIDVTNIDSDEFQNISELELCNIVIY